MKEKVVPLRRVRDEKGLLPLQARCRDYKFLFLRQINIFVRGILDWFIEGRSAERIDVQKIRKKKGRPSPH